MPLLWLAVCAGAACAGADAEQSERVVVIAGSAVGAEGEALRASVAAFQAQHPKVRVEIRATPDGGDERHQLYVQWFAAGAREPDLLQVDVVWTPELAAAGFIAPVDAGLVDGFFPGAVAAGRYAGELWAVPWFMDVGLLYWRTDVMASAPATLDALREAARARPASVADGFAWQGARYEGLVCSYLEILTGMGGAILDPAGAVVVDSEPATRALSFLVELVGDASPKDVVGWREEEARFSFQNGEAAFMRNWPYAAPLLADAGASKVAGRFAVAPMPGDGVHPGGAALGGQALALNARSRDPAMAKALLAFLTSEGEQRRRAAIAGQYPPRRALYDDGSLAGLLPIDPSDAKAILAQATPRPASPAWPQLSGILQIHLHRALTRQVAPRETLAAAAAQMRAALANMGAPTPGAAHASPVPVLPLFFGLVVLAVLALGWLTTRPATTEAARNERFGWRLLAPALVLMAGLGGAPLVLTFAQATLDLDLRQPWRGAPFVGARLLQDAVTEPRFLQAALHTLAFTVISVGLELLLGLALALALNRAFRGRGLVRGAALIPWAIPAVVGAILWRFLFDTLAPDVAWNGDATLAWVPVIVADVWKTTPFVALLLLAGLSQIDPALFEAADMDGASARDRLWHIVLPLLRPAMLVALLFRTLDALRVFDLIFVMTGGGPGTATEVLSVVAHDTMMRDLRIGAGAAMSAIIFGASLVLALIYVRVVGEREAAP